MKTLRLVLLVIVILVASLSVAQAQNNQRDNCVVTPLQIQGQGHTMVVGAEGEIQETVDVATLAADQDYILDVFAAIGAGTENVAILIVDEFPPNMTSNNQGNRPPATTHGELVLEVFEQMIAQLGVTNIQLVPVNVAAGQSGRYRTSSIAREIERTIGDLQDDGIQRFVINMSFAVIPCQDGSFDFDRFNNGRASDPSQSLIGTQGEGNALGLLEKVRDEDKLDPLHVLLAELLEQNTTDGFAVMAVASSGNLGADAPFYPAGWPEVISVSASEGTASTLWGFSNQGAIMTPGAWYLFADQYYRAGTSFAAPVMSVIAALYLTHTDIPCDLAAGTAPLVDVTAYENQTFDEALNCTLP